VAGLYSGSLLAPGQSPWPELGPSLARAWPELTIVGPFRAANGPERYRHQLTRRHSGGERPGFGPSLKQGPDNLNGPTTRNWTPLVISTLASYLASARTMKAAIMQLNPRHTAPP
jgi:hypothetical protein